MTDYATWRRDKMALSTEDQTIMDYVDAPVGGDDAQLDALLNGVKGTGETTAAPEATQEEIRVVKKGDTLLRISQEVGVPLEDLARQNQITDVNLIYPGQEIRYTKPAPLPVETDISATEGLTIDPEGTTTAVEALTGRPVTKEPFSPEVLRKMGAVASSDEGTPSGQAMVADFESIPVDAPVELAESDVYPPLDGPPVVEEPDDVEDLGITDQTEAQAKQTAQIVGATLSDDSKTVYTDVIDQIDELGFDPLDEKAYEKIAADINSRIEDYNINISTIASEKQKPTFEGWDKFLAVLGAAMGAYGSAMTGVPNFALKVVNDAIDRDTQKFLKSKEARTKTLENQRLDLIMMRGEKLQLAQNRVTQLMQSESFKLAKAEAKANIQGIMDGLEQEKATNLQNLKMVMAGHIVKLITSEQALAATLNKEEKAKLVSHITFKDGKGGDFLAPAYVAPTEAEAIKDREKQKITSSIIEIADELEPLYEDAARFAPGAFSETRIRINALNKKLESVVKIALGMGAHYTPYEVTIIAAQIPSASDWTEMVGTAKMKINALRNSMVIDMKSARQGVVANYSAVSQKREIPGLKKGAIKTSK